jgi:regulator of sigma E protease
MNDAEKKQSFYFKSIPQKMAIILAGPLANILLCFVLLFFSSFILGIIEVKPIIKEMLPNSAAARYGLQSGDIFTQINGQKINHVAQVQRAVIGSFGEKMDFKIIRGSEELDFSFAPDMAKANDKKNKEQIPTLGVVFKADKQDVLIKKYDFLNAVVDAYDKTYFVAEITLTFFKQLFIGKAPLEQITGPVRIGDAAGTALQEGMWSFLFLMAIISMSIGIVNLLPVPMLDGGHLMFYVFEAIGLKANDTLREILFKSGFVLVIILMIFTIVNDIMIIGDY